MSSKTVRIDRLLIKNAVQIMGVAERLYAIDCAERGLLHVPRGSSESYAIETMVSNQIFHMQGVNDPRSIQRPEDPRFAAIYDEAVRLWDSVNNSPRVSTPDTRTRASLPK